jgi:hypothetical protein
MTACRMYNLETMAVVLMIEETVCPDRPSKSVAGKRQIRGDPCLDQYRPVLCHSALFQWGQLQALVQGIVFAVPRHGPPRYISAFYVSTGIIRRWAGAPGVKRRRRAQGQRNPQASGLLVSRDSRHNKPVGIGAPLQLSSPFSSERPR